MRVRRQPDDWRDRPLRLAADVSPAWAPSALTAASMPSGFKTRNTRADGIIDAQAAEPDAALGAVVDESTVAK